MGLHGTHFYPEKSRYFLILIAPMKKRQHLALAASETSLPGTPARPRATFLDAMYQRGGDLGTAMDPTKAHFTNCVPDLFNIRIPEYNSREPGLEERNSRSGISIVAKRDEFGLRREAPNGPKQLYLGWGGKVDDRHLGPGTPEPFKTFRSATTEVDEIQVR